MKNFRFSLQPSGPPLLLLVALSTACSSDPAEPAPPANPWDGQTYYLEVPLVNWSEPRGIGTDIADYVPGFLLRVEGEEPEAFQVMTGMTSIEGAQNTCNKTDHLSASAEPPGVIIGPSEFPVHIQHFRDPIAVDGTVYDLTLTNVLPEGDTISEIGELIATMDFRQIYALFTILPNPTPEGVCVSLEMAHEVPCAPCPTDGEPYCLTVKAIDLGAVPFDGEITPIDTLDPSCTPTPTAP